MQNIGVYYHKFWSTLFIILFAALLYVKLFVYPTLLWILVGLPIYAPPLISLTIALYYRAKYLKKLWDNPF